MGVDGYLTYVEAAEALGVSAQRVRQLVRRGQLDCVRIGGARGVPHVTPESVRARIASKPRAGNPSLGSDAPDMPEGYMAAGEAAAALGVDVSRISAMVADGQLDGGKFGGWYGVTRESVEARAAGELLPAKGIEAEEVGGYVTLTDAARMLGISKGRVSQLVKRGVISAERERGGKSLLIPLSEVERRIRTKPGNGNPSFVSEREGESLERAPDGYLTMPEAVRRLGVSRQRVQQLIACGKLEGGRYLDGSGRALLHVSPESVERRLNGASGGGVV